MTDGWVGFFDPVCISDLALKISIIRVKEKFIPFLYTFIGSLDLP